jgi:hypothetical protein
MKALTRRRFLFCCTGLAYGIAYAFFSVMVTGGGHGNFLWMMIYGPPIAGPIGFFVATSALAADLRSKWSKLSLGMLLILHYALLIVNIAFPQGELALDNAKMLAGNAGTLVFMSAVYLIGQVGLILALFRGLSENYGADFEDARGGLSLKS